MDSTITPSGQRIIDEALELFASKGFSSTTTREIAEKAGVNEVTLFRIFRTKENLLEMVLINKFDIGSIQGSLNMRRMGDPRKDLLTMIAVVRENLSNRRTFFQLLLREQATNSIVREHLGHFPLLIKEIIIRNMKEILSDHVNEDFDHETAGLFLYSYFLRSEMMSAMFGADPLQEIDETHIDTVLDIFLNGVLPGGEAR